MVKLRTLIPVNAKPGKSIIQVVNPRTGKPSRVRVPKDAVPGQAIELDIPEELDASSDHISSSGAPNEQSRLPPTQGLASVAPGHAPEASYPTDSAQKNIGPTLDGSNNISDPSSSVGTNLVSMQYPEQPVEHTIVYSSPPVVSQPMYVSQPVAVIGAQPVIYQQPVVYQQNPGVVIVKEDKKNVDNDDCMAAMCGACACTWLLVLLSGRH